MKRTTDTHGLTSYIPDLSNSSPDSDQRQRVIRRNGQKVPHYFQGDSDWAERLLNRDDTIASAGCAVTSVAMCLKYFGRTVTPLDVDAQLDRTGGYIAGSDGISDWDSAFATRAGAGLLVTRLCSVRLYQGGKRDEMYKLIREQLDQNLPVIGRIKYADSTADMNHFVVIVGRTREGQHIINDPGLSAGNGAADPALPNVVIETATRRGGLALVGIDCLRIARQER